MESAVARPTRARQGLGPPRGSPATRTGRSAASERCGTAPIVPAGARRAPGVSPGTQGTSAPIARRVGRVAGVVRRGLHRRPAVAAERAQHASGHRPARRPGLDPPARTATGQPGERVVPVHPVGADVEGVHHDREDHCLPGAARDFPNDTSAACVAVAYRNGAADGTRRNPSSRSAGAMCSRSISRYASCAVAPASPTGMLTACPNALFPDTSGRSRPCTCKACTCRVAA